MDQKRLFVRLAGALVLTALAASCSSDKAAGPTGEKTCTELGDSVAKAAGTAAPVFKVIRPNGWETFKVGDTMHVRVTGNLDANNAVVFLAAWANNAVKFGFLSNSSGSRNVYRNCDTAFVIPDSMASVFGGGTFSTGASDSDKVRIEEYNNAPNNDLSDHSFNITP